MGRIFISSSSDVTAERREAVRLINRIGRQFGRSDAMEGAYIWETDQAIDGFARRFQDDIPRVSSEEIELPIFILSERIGLPLPADIEVPREIVEYTDMLGQDFALPAEFNSSLNRTPLTGTLFELFDALANDVPCIIFCKGDPSTVINSSLDPYDRSFGFNIYKDTFLEAHQHIGNQDRLKAYLDMQSRGVARLYDKVLSGRKCEFYTDQADFLAKLEHHLEAHYRPSEKNTIDRMVKGLAYFDVDDSTIFCGRELEVAEAYEQLYELDSSTNSKPLLLLRGYSGVGKSSFLRAGLAARALLAIKDGTPLLPTDAKATLRPVIVTPQHLMDCEGSTVSYLGRLLEEIVWQVGLEEARDGASKDDCIVDIEQQLLKHKVRPLLLFDQVEDVLLTSPRETGEYWSSVFELIDRWSIQRRAWAVLSIADTARQDGANEGWIAKWQAAALIAPLPKENELVLSGLDVGVMNDIFTTTFTRRGIKVPRATRSALRNMLSPTGIFRGEHSNALPVVSVALQLTSQNVEKRLELEYRQLVPVRYDQRRVPVQSQLNILDIVNGEVQEGDLVSPEIAIERIAETALREFVEEDMGLEWPEDGGALPTEVEAIFQRFLRWLVFIEESPFETINDQNELNLDAIVLRSERRSRIEHDLGPYGPQLVQRFMTARLVRTDKQLLITLSHKFLVGRWHRATDWLQVEARWLETHYSLKTHRNQVNPQAPTAEDLTNWRKLYEAWGPSGPWRREARGKSRIADLPWLQTHLFSFEKGKTNDEELRVAFRSALIAGDDEMALQVARRCWAKQSARTILAEPLPTSLSPNLSPPILYAAERGLFEVVKFLVGRINQPYRRNAMGQSILHRLAANGQASILQSIAQRLGRMPAIQRARLFPAEDGEPLIAAAGGWTPIHYALRNGSVESVRWLCKIYKLIGVKKLGKISVSGRAFPGSTPFHLAARLDEPQSIQTIRALMEIEDIRTEMDAHAWRPIHVAIKRDNGKTLAELIKRTDASHFTQRRMGKDIDINDTPLSLAARIDAYKCARTLIDAGVLKMGKGKAFKEAVRMASGYGADRVFDLFWPEIAKNPLSTLSDTDTEGRNAVHLAAQFRRVDILKRWVSHENCASYINLQDNLGRTPLYLAAAFRDHKAEKRTEDTIRTLLAHGADPTKLSSTGESPLWAAIQSRDEVAISQLSATAGPDTISESQIQNVLRIENEQLKNTIFKRVFTGDYSLRCGEDGGTILHEAAFTDSYDVLNSSLSERPDLLNERDERGRTPLHSAIEGSSPNSVRRLLEAGADMRSIPNNGRTIFHLAAFKEGLGNIEAIMSHLAEKDLEFLRAQRDDNGKTALHTAAEFASVELIRSLLDAGFDALASIENANEPWRHETPAHMAAFRGNVLTLRAMHERDPEISKKSLMHRAATILHSASAGGQLHCVKHLFELDEESTYRSLYVSDASGATPLGKAVEAWRKAMIKEKRMLEDAEVNGSDRKDLDEENALLHSETAWQLIEFLEQKLDDKKYCPTEFANRTPDDPAALCAAIRSERHDLLQHFLDRGMRKIIVPGGWKSPLHHAVSRGDHEAFSMLCHDNSDIDFLAGNANGQTLMHEACRKGNSNFIPILLELGLPPNDQDAHGRTPADYALRHGHDETIEVLQASVGGEVSLYSEQSINTVAYRLRSAILKEDLEAISSLLEVAGKDEEVRAQAIATASSNDKLDALALLLDGHPARLWIAPANSKAPPIYWATRSAQTNLLKQIPNDLLRTHINEAFHEGQTLLHAAVASGEAHLVEWLVENGANVTKQNYYGRTPLHDAAFQACVSCVEALLREAPGDLLELADERGRTALHQIALSVAKDDEKQTSNKAVIIDTLLKAGADPLATDNRDMTPAALAWKLGDKNSAFRLDAMQLETAAFASEETTDQNNLGDNGNEKNLFKYKTTGSLIIKSLRIGSFLLTTLTICLVIIVFVLMTFQSS